MISSKIGFWRDSCDGLLCVTFCPVLVSHCDILSLLLSLFMLLLSFQCGKCNELALK